MRYLRWQVNISPRIITYIKCLTSRVVQSLTAKLDIQILDGKYYLCNKSYTMLQKIMWRAVGEFSIFHFHDMSPTSSILGEEKAQQSIEGAT